MGLLQDALFQQAAAAALCSGLLCALLGVFVHLKRIVFVGIALSETAAFGVALGLSLGIEPGWTASGLTVFVSLLFALPNFRMSASREALLGLVYCTAAAGAVLLLALNPLAEARGVDLVSGNLLYATRKDIRSLASLWGAVTAVHLVLYRKLLAVSLDPETTQTLGIRVRSHECVFYFSLGMAIAVSLKIAGVLFVFASLVVPPMAGLALSRRVSAVFGISLFTALLAIGIGLAASFFLDLPAAPTIVCVQGILLLLCWTLRPLF